MREGLRQRRRPPPTAIEVEDRQPADCKRRKAASPKGHDGAHDQSTTAPGEDGDVDCISNLPDDNLCHIISLLPTKDGARTQILASRWRHLWRSAPLNLDYNGLAADEDEDAFAEVVPRILSAHLGPGRRFCIPLHHFLGSRAAASDVWLQSPALDNLQELEFIEIPHISLPDQLLPPPASTFRFSATLLVFTLGRGNLPDDITRALHFPLLKHLTLGRVNISDCSLHSMISGCPAIECLLIKGSYGFRSIRINSSTLRTICVDVGVPCGTKHGQFKELVIDNAPCLRRLLGVNFIHGLHTSVVSAPKLEALGCYPGNDFPSSSIVFSSAVMQGLPVVDSLTMAACTVKILAVYMFNPSLDTFIESLRCFPCLEKLYIVSGGFGRKNNLWRRKHRNLIKCLDIRLKNIVLQSYGGRKHEVNFATFFVLNAKVLECMTLIVPDMYYNENFVELQREKLQLENRASRGALFHFMARKNSPVRNVMYRGDVHDMDLTDPFTC